MEQQSQALRDLEEAQWNDLIVNGELDEGPALRGLLGRREVAQNRTPSRQVRRRMERKGQAITSRDTPKEEKQNDRTA